MQLRDLGEFGLIARIERAARRRGPAVVLGIGDDAALLRPRPGEDVAVSTDALVEDVHFRFATESPRNAGRRALAAALSDLAAMGARPLGFTCALAAPPRLAVRVADGLVAGLLAEAARHGCPLVGGNLSRAREVSVTLTVVGAVARGRALTRAGARAGDRLCVTGVLGVMALVVARAERGLGRVQRVPVPRLAAGRALAGLPGIGGCIDLSDGLEADAGQLLRGTGLAAEIEPARLPRPRGFDAACARLGLDPLRLALSGGEDYELLFSVRRDGPSPERLTRRLGVPVAEVGRVVPRRRARARSAAGWRHF